MHWGNKLTIIMGNRKKSKDNPKGASVQQLLASTKKHVKLKRDAVTAINDLLEQAKEHTQHANTAIEQVEVWLQSAK